MRQCRRWFFVEVSLNLEWSFFDLVHVMRRQHCYLFVLVYRKTGYLNANSVSIYSKWNMEPSGNKARMWTDPVCTTPPRCFNPTVMGWCLVVLRRRQGQKIDVIWAASAWGVRWIGDDYQSSVWRILPPSGTGPRPRRLHSRGLHEWERGWHT